MSKIKKVTAKEILDSHKNPTVEVACELESGFVGVASVPSGKSTGSHEAAELRDGDPGRYGGRGVLRAVENINAEVDFFVVGKEFDQNSLDKALIGLDGTKNKSRLGANAILGVSLAFARACALEENLQLYEYLGNLAGNNKFKLPNPAFNLIEGGKHAENGLDIQEFLIVPCGADAFEEKVKIASKIIRSLEEILKKDGYQTEDKGDEGGFAPKLSSNERALDLLTQAISFAGYSSNKIKLAIDAAASSFYRNGLYNLSAEKEKQSLSFRDIVNWYRKLADNYSLIYIEDGLSEEDWAGFADLNRALGGKTDIVGDDLLVTNLGRIKKAIEEKAVNTALIKPNQIGTLTETLEAVSVCRQSRLKVFISHRAGETMDTFISDLSVGLSCDYFKAGSLSEKEHMCKYERLIEIENILKKQNEN